MCAERIERTNRSRDGVGRRAGGWILSAAAIVLLQGCWLTDMLGLEEPAAQPEGPSAKELALQATLNACFGEGSTPLVPVTAETEGRGFDRDELKAVFFPDRNPDPYYGESMDEDWIPAILNVFGGLNKNGAADLAEQADALGSVGGAAIEAAFELMWLADPAAAIARLTHGDPLYGDPVTENCATFARTSAERYDVDVSGCGTQSTGGIVITGPSAALDLVQAMVEDGVPSLEPTALKGTLQIDFDAMVSTPLPEECLEWDYAPPPTYETCIQYGSPGTWESSAEGSIVVALDIEEAELSIDLLSGSVGAALLGAVGFRADAVRFANSYIGYDPYWGGEIITSGEWGLDGSASLDASGSVDIAVEWSGNLESQVSSMGGRARLESDGMNFHVANSGFWEYGPPVDRTLRFSGIVTATVDNRGSDDLSGISCDYDTCSGSYSGDASSSMDVTAANVTVSLTEGEAVSLLRVSAAATLKDSSEMESSFDDNVIDFSEAASASVEIGCLEAGLVVQKPGKDDATSSLLLHTAAESSASNTGSGSFYGADGTDFERSEMRARVARLLARAQLGTRQAEGALYDITYATLVSTTDDVVNESFVTQVRTELGVTLAGFVNFQQDPFEIHSPLPFLVYEESDCSWNDYTYEPDCNERAEAEGRLLIVSEDTIALDSANDDGSRGDLVLRLNGEEVRDPAGNPPDLGLLDIEMWQEYLMGGGYPPY